jgi:hypothetical protein
MDFTLHRGKRYRSTLTLGFIENLFDNDVIAGKFREAGFIDVKVTGHGDIRHAEGVWNGDDVKPTYPPQISDISEVTA